MHYAASLFFLALMSSPQSFEPQGSLQEVKQGLLPSEEGDDPLLWLEDVLGDKALGWVRAQNEVSKEALAEGPEFKDLEAKLLAIYDSDERIPYVTKRGEYYYNFWRDADHKRGLWRRTTLESYQKEEPEWDVLLDLDALGEEEGENWVWAGSSVLPPSYERCLISLSRGGADADVTREFDIPSRSFVGDGFFLPEAKSRAGWIDRDTLYVATDFGEGSMTESGYPRVVKIWKRGQQLSEAETVFEGTPEDISVGAYRDHTPGWERDFVYRRLTFYTGELLERNADGELVRIDKPDHCEASIDQEWIYFEPRKDWKIGEVTYKAGSLLVADYAAWQEGKHEVEVLFEPGPTTSLASFSTTRDHVLVNLLDNVKSRIDVITHTDKGWKHKPLEGVPTLGRISASPVDAWHSNAYWLNVTGYTTPSSLFHGDLEGGEPRLLKQLPAFFDAEGIEVSQHFARSSDGTAVPYFQVTPPGLEADGNAPTLLYGYGGFEISLLPSYKAAVGTSWLARGGVYVVANIRGGGEFGPAWHQAALREKRQRAYDDFAAVARDLIERGITQPAHLGIQGGSNGGLLMGNMLTQFPELFGAVVCQVPLLDMKRYTKLLAGASWAGEYGDPDVEEDWAFLRRYSPYHNIDVEQDYPSILFTTSTRDDRVHPGHARKMAAALLSVGKEVLYYENIEGGHGGAADNEQAAFMSALAYSFLWKTLTAGGS